MKIVENNISKIVLPGVEIEKLEQKGDFYYKCDEDKLQNSEKIEIRATINYPTNHGDNLTACTAKERQSFQQEAYKKNLTPINVMRSIPLSNETDWIKKPNTKIEQASASELNSENNINKKKGFCNYI